MSTEPVLRRRSPEAAAAYLAGFEAGAKAALAEVRRLNFSDVADRAESHLALSLRAVTHASEDAQAP